MWSGLDKFVPGSKIGEDCRTCPEPCEDHDPDVRGGATASTPDGRIQDGSSATGCYYNSRKDVGDNYVGLIEYASGLRGTFDMSFCSSGPRERTFTIVGSRGEIRGDAEGARLEIAKRRPGAAPEVFDLREESRGHHCGGDWRQVKRFLETLREGRRQSLATGMDGLRAVGVGEAMERSIAEDRPVSLAKIFEE
jgi:predicted dehydrogenase